MTTATHRVLPFGAYGATFTERVDRATILDEAALNWTTQVAPAYTLDRYDESKATKVADWFVTKRSDTGHPFGCVGKRYTPLHNHELVDFLHALVDVSDGELDLSQATSWEGGNKVAFALNIGEGRDVKLADDPHVPYLVATTSHDGSYATRISPFHQRLQCMNQLPSLRAKSLVTIRHTKSAHDRLRHARESLNLVWSALTEFDRDIQRLIDLELTNQEAARLLNKAFPIPPAEKSTGRTSPSARRRAEVEQMMNTDPRVTNLPYGSAYRWFQAISTWEQHARPATVTATGAERLARNVLGEHTHSNRASQHLLSLVDAGSR